VNPSCNRKGENGNPQPKAGASDFYPSTKTPISLQDLRKSLYVKAKAEPMWRFWGLYAHVCKRETLQETVGLF
jgi:hypothetical protein